jgi:hypothetical protein
LLAAKTKRTKKRASQKALTVQAPEQALMVLNMTGSENEEFGDALLTQVLSSLWLKGADDDHRDRRYIAALMAMKGLAPHDELEGMLAAQMVATHNAAMDCFRRAMIPGQTLEGREQSLKHAGKLSRTYADQMEALGRYRGKGEQKVTVEHVHVHQGGQAVVGAVSLDDTSGGEGDRPKTAE